MKNLTSKIKLFDPSISSKEELAVKQVLHSHFWASGSGAGKVKEFEDKFVSYTGSKSCVAVSNGTAALHLALSLFDIKGKEVILPSLSFVSTAHAVIYNGGIPKFVDVDPKTLCLDPSEIDNAITKKTKVVLPVHFAGTSCNLEKIKHICSKNNLALVEDAAHAAGTTYKNKKIGSHGNPVCFSFHPVKNLAMPTGGAITLNNQEAKKFETVLKSRRWCGIANRKGTRYDISNLGWNYYMNEFSAAIGIEQLKKLDKLNSKRQRNAKRLSKNISLDEKMPFDKNSSYHFYWILVKNRDAFMKKMLEHGIETGIHYLPIHKMKYYNSKTKLAHTEKITKEIVSLPCHPNLAENDIEKIISLTNKFSK